MVKSRWSISSVIVKNADQMPTTQMTNRSDLLQNPSELEIVRSCSFSNVKGKENPYGNSIGFALDIIVVQPSSTADEVEVGANHGSSDVIDEGIDSGTDNEPRLTGIFASSDFAVHFPDCSPDQSYVVQIQINGRLLDGSFLSMKPPEHSKNAVASDHVMFEFLQGGSSKPPTEALQKLVCLGILNPGRNLIRYVLSLRAPIEQNDEKIQSCWTGTEVSISSYRENGDKEASIGFADAYIYLWSVNDTIIISDIDGTLTKSNMRGAIDTIVTKNYRCVHDGVCAFFSNIVQQANNPTIEPNARLNDASLSSKRSGLVRILYLSCRPLSLINTTRKFLGLVSQSKCGTAGQSSDYCFFPSSINGNQSVIGMPPGPIFVHRGKLSTVLKTELLHKSTHEFKADLLTRQVLLPFVAAGKKSASTLFVAGFGNRTTDEKAYEMVGIKKSNIYTINKGSLLVSSGEKRQVDAKENFDEEGSCGVHKLLDPTISFCTSFQATSGKGPISPTNISMKSPKSSIDGYIIETYEGYSDPQLTKSLTNSLREGNECN